MNKQEKLRLLLREKYLCIKSRNPQFSLRGFAVKLGISSGSLVDFMKGNRNFSSRKLESVLDKLDLSTEERNKFEAILDENDEWHITFNINKSAAKELSVLFDKFVSKALKASINNPGDFQYEFIVQTKLKSQISNLPPASTSGLTV